jgi:hypothetical protein
MTTDPHYARVRQDSIVAQWEVEFHDLAPDSSPYDYLNCTNHLCQFVHELIDNVVEEAAAAVEAWRAGILAQLDQIAADAKYDADRRSMMDDYRGAREGLERQRTAMEAARAVRGEE